MKITVDELKQKYAVLPVAPYGDCIVVPGAEFNPDWEVSLGDQGFKCHFTDLDGHAVALVQLKKAAAEGKVVYVPPKTEESFCPDCGKEMKFNPKYPNRSSNAKWECENNECSVIKVMNDGTVIRDSTATKESAPPVKKLETETPQKQNSGNSHPKMPWLKDLKFWSPDEDALIIELWKKGLALEKISVEVNKKYPERVGNATKARVYQLQRKGRIEKRHKPKLKAAKAPSVIKSEKSTELVEPVSFVEVASVEKTLQTLTEACDSLSKAYVDLKTEFDNLNDFVLANMAVKYKIDNLQRDFIKHKHAEKTGEAMVPPEASA